MPQSGGDFGQLSCSKIQRPCTPAMVCDQCFGVGGINTWGVDTNQLHATICNGIHERRAHRPVLRVEGVGIRMGLGPHQQSRRKITIRKDRGRNGAITGPSITNAGP